MSIAKAGLEPSGIHIVNTHATATPQGDIQECEAIRAVFGQGCPDTWINNTKMATSDTSHGRRRRPGIGRQPALVRRSDRPGPSHDQRRRSRLPVRPARAGAQTSPEAAEKVDTILNNSFGMLGINSTLLIVKRFVP